MRMERHYVNELGIVLSEYLKDPRSDCEGIDLEVLHRCVHNHIRKRTQWAREEAHGTLNPEYVKRCEELLTMGIMMLKMYINGWVAKEDITWIAPR